jgi:hypothetical protein
MEASELDERVIRLWLNAASRATQNVFEAGAFGLLPQLAQNRFMY